MQLVSPRLRLRLLSADETAALLDGRPKAGLRWDDEYPLDGTLVAAAIQAELHGAGTEPGPFGQYQVVLRDDATVIGDIGFHAPPDELGMVEVGFGIVPGRRRRGYATEALSTLLDWALARPEVRAVHADTDLVNLASQSVLARAGMELIADEGDRKRYQIHPVRA